MPEHIEIRGGTQPLVWHFDRAASRVESSQIQLVYHSDSPRLKLLWQWRARASKGPLEHTIVIKNLSNEAVWASCSKR